MFNTGVLDAAPAYVVASAMKDTATTIFVFAFAATSWRHKKASNGIPTLSSLDNFFSNRYVFINDGLKKQNSVFHFKNLNERSQIIVLKLDGQIDYLAAESSGPGFKKEEYP